VINPVLGREGQSALTIFIGAIVLLVVALILMRVFSQGSTMTSSMRTTRDRRSGRDRRQRRIPVRRERRKRIRRQEDVAAQYVSSLRS
jgi:hypothetical protein